MIVTYPKKPKTITTPERIFVKPHAYMFAGMGERKSEGEVEYRKVATVKPAVWAAKTPRGDIFFSGASSHSRDACERATARQMGVLWSTLEQRGWRIVKVRMEVIEE